jgi:hypothetical protein
MFVVMNHVHQKEDPYTPILPYGVYLFEGLIEGCLQAEAGDRAGPRRALGVAPGSRASGEALQTEEGEVMVGT